MARKRQLQESLRPLYVAPVFDRREREALRQWRAARFHGPRHMPKPGEFDPLALRVGLRACNVDNRAGWVVSNPGLDEALRRRPDLDESLPGPGWLRRVYRTERALVVLPGVRAVVDARMEALRAAEQPTKAEPAPVAAPQQPDLFSLETV